MIRNLVFDMGNVLIHWKPYLFVEDGTRGKSRHGPARPPTPDPSAGHVFLANVLENHDRPRAPGIFLPEGDVCYESVTALAALSVLLRARPPQLFSSTRKGSGKGTEAWPRP